MSSALKALLLGTALFTFAPVAAAQTQPNPTKQAPPASQPQAQTPGGAQSQAPDLQQMRQTQRAQMRSQISAAIERVQGACREELHSFCQAVTPGEGRRLLCMQAHADKLSNQCELALYDASRNIRQAMHRVERIAEACWNDIKTQCSGGGSVEQCMHDKRASFSRPCQVVMASFQPDPQASQAQASLAGVPIFSSDGMRLGAVTGARTGLDGKVQLIQAEIGSPLGLGTANILISPDELEWQGNAIRLRMGAEQVRAVLEAQQR